MNQFKAMLSLDCLFSLLPILLIIFYTLTITSLIVEKSNKLAQSQILFDKLTSIADYTVELALAEKTEDARWPSLVKTTTLDESEIAQLRVTFDLNALSIGDEPSSATCIYRLVIVDKDIDSKEIEKIYVCGG